MRYLFIDRIQSILLPDIYEKWQQYIYSLNGVYTKQLYYYLRDNNSKGNYNIDRINLENKKIYSELFLTHISTGQFDDFGKYHMNVMRKMRLEIL